MKRNNNNFIQGLYELSYKFFKKFYSIFDKDDRRFMYNISVIFIAINLYIIMNGTYTRMNIVWVILLFISVILNHK